MGSWVLLNDGDDYDDVSVMFCDLGVRWRDKWCVFWMCSEMCVLKFEVNVFGRVFFGVIFVMGLMSVGVF